VTAACWPPDKIKIDRAFVSAIARNSHAAAVLPAQARSA
jgi:EAL domain-containing protein (putative c-di-GMP-specific phosphodiesterase class I)